MQRRIQLTILLFAGLLCSHCKKYLEIQPEDKYTEDQVYTSEATIKQALNGLYINLSGSYLYGGALTSTIIETLARRYNVGTGHLYNSWINDYPVRDRYGPYNQIWVTAYSTIIKTNIFLRNLERSGGVISSEKATQLKGEALAIRAMLHFDLLRLYGPVYGTTDSTAAAIPYYASADAQAQPLLPANQVMDRVLADLSAAEASLASDPVITSGILTGNDIDYYHSFRNRRFNYYAVKGLKARAYLYRRDATSAHREAAAVLEQGEQWFAWLPYAAILNAGANPDRVFSTEVLAGLYNPNLYNTYNQYFAPTLIDYSMLTAHKDRLPLVFENNQNDWRYPSTWIVNASNIRTFRKFADMDDQQKPWRFLQPLLRKSEMYYILAETDPDPDQALQYLNTVRNNRGLPGLGSGIDLQQEITKEYQKEFWGEGQLFFYYKRQNMPSIPSGTGTGTINSPVYTVPLPYTEIDLR